MTLVFAVGRRIEDGETMGTYFIVRHGETLANRSGILQGHLNVPLSDHGRKQADLAVSYTHLTWPSRLYAYATLTLSSPERTSNLVRANPVNPFKTDA